MTDAVGAQLDVLGKIVGQVRLGSSDDDYRRYIQARIAANRASGKREELINVAKLVLSDPTVKILLNQEGTATARMLLNGTVSSDVAGIVLAMCTAAVALGVRLVVEWMPSPPANTFRFDSGPGLDVGHLAGADDNSGN
ncbi:MAG TPA: hypothetical protein VGL61_06540 [Kofleriaceae bacterium]